MVAEAEVILQGHLQCCVGSARLEQGAVTLKAMTGVYMENLSLQRVIKCRGHTNRKKTHTMLFSCTG